MHSSQTQGKAAIMRRSHGEKGENYDCREENSDTAQWAVMVRGDQGDERTDD